MGLRFKGNTIFYPKGASRDDVVSMLDKRIEKRSIEIERREWIAKEYERLCKLQEEDKKWRTWVSMQSEWDGSPILDNGDITPS